MRTFRRPALWGGLLALMLLALPAMPTLTAQNTPVLTVTVPNFWQETLTDDVLAPFEAQYGVDVNVEFTPGFFLQTADGNIENRFSSTDETVHAGDVIYVDSNSLYVEATQAGYFLDLAPLVNSDPSLNTADFFPTVWQSYQWNGGVWALPISTDVIVVTYDPAAFDQAGIAYPNERWTIDDFATAARQLTQYNADGGVAVPGMTTLSGGDVTNIFLRSLLTSGLYDPNAFPNTPLFSTDPNLAYILETFSAMQTEGVVMSAASFADVDPSDIPLRIEGRFGYFQGGFGNNAATPTVRYASLLPNSTAGLDVQALAVSSGTLYPEQAYALAKFLTNLPGLGNNFFSVSPARQSFVGQQNVIQGGGGPGGGGGFGIPAEIQPVIDQAIQVALPVSELRYTNYLSSALNEMQTSGSDATTALQNAEVQAQTDMQTALAKKGTFTVTVATPVPTPQLAAGEIALNFGLNSGFGGGPGGAGQIPNESEWQTVINEFSASHPVVGNVNISAVQGNNLSEMAQEYDCFVLPNNAVPGSDLSALLNLDPLMDTDTSFDRNDVLGNTLSQLQQDNRTWAMPLALQPQMLSYDTELFALAGVPAPTNGWTTDGFIDALQTLKAYLGEDVEPFIPNDPTGAYMMLLIGAFGGIPLDYRTSPPTVNFTDPNTVAAIQQVLDLAKAGYIEYGGLSELNGNRIFISIDSEVALTTNTLNRFIGNAPGQPPGESSTALTFYPSGTQYNVMAYEITTGYISANAQNPEACYDWLSTLARNPQLFSGMPARRTLLNDPAVQAAQGPEMVSAYQQLDALLQAPNTIVLPVTSLGGGNATNFVTEFWLKRAFDRYVLEDADLATELADAQTYTVAFLECQAAVVATDTGENQGNGGLFQALNDCASSVDPTFTLFD